MGGWEMYTVFSSGNLKDRDRWKNIRMYLRETEYRRVDWILLARTETSGRLL
jgi:hypothetical protein